MIDSEKSIALCALDNMYTAVIMLDHNFIVKYANNATITLKLLFIIESIVLLICHKVTNNRPNSAQTHPVFSKRNYTKDKL